MRLLFRPRAGKKSRALRSFREQFGVTRRSSVKRKPAPQQGLKGVAERVFEQIDAAPHGKTCEAIVGIIEEGQEVMREYKGKPALDVGLLAAAQAVEHYEIARYGTLKTWASELGLKDAVPLLEATLGEEKKTDETLTQIAETAVNQRAEAAE
jgi:ferritin-like metal-binding protein YciE